MRSLALACGLLLACSLVAPAAGARKLSAPAPAAAGPAPGDQPEYFITISDGEFVKGCERFVLAGWNQWEVVEAAAGAPSLSGASLPANMTGPQLVRDLLNKGKAHGFNVMRTWAHSVNPQYATQTAPGRYNEAALRGLDYLLDEARKAGIRLVLAFTSNWTPTGGIPEYLKWGGSTDQVDFYTKPEIKDMYKGFVETILNRVNSINGRTFKDDPTVMAWNLLNEPRCNGCPNGTVAAWYAEMARFVKGIDANHLVTTGEEGFYSCCGNAANPGQPWTEWAAEEGQDFMLDHSSPAIDYATIHAWVDNWQQVDPKWLVNWITAHARDAQTVLKKPLVLEEFGKWVTPGALIGGKVVAATLEERNQFLEVAYAEIDKLEAGNTGLKGSLFWQWYNQGQEAAASEGGGRGLFGIFDTDDAFKYIAENAQVVAKLNAQPLAGCVAAAHKAAPADPAPDCRQTWVNNTPGTGMEGPECNVPINECVRGTAACDPHAICIDTEAGYECQCYWGYSGDGRKCAPNNVALAQLAGLYWSEPKGLGCDAGLDVAWPTDAPGFLYDPMGSFAFYRNGTADFGSRKNVTLQECSIACQQSPDCEGFVINEVLQQCYLKNGSCPAYNSCGGQVVLCNSTNDRGESFSFECGSWVSYYRLDMDVQAACSNVSTVAPGTPPNNAALKAFGDFEQAYMAKYGGELMRITPGAEPAPPTVPPAAEPATTTVPPAAAPATTTVPPAAEPAVPAVMPSTPVAEPSPVTAAPAASSVDLLEPSAPLVQAASLP